MLENWKIQIRKGYLELCILLMIDSEGKLYGFDIINRLKREELPVKEGTLYPLLNRMTKDGVLESFWETENIKGHPRKFYRLTPVGRTYLKKMSTEFDAMVTISNRMKTKAFKPGNRRNA